MDSAIVARLLELNRQFYQSQAAAFSATRGRVNPGAAQLLGRVPARARVLDLGCGNGTAAAFLAERGFAGEYVGLDASAGLLAAARARGLGERYVFAGADLAGDWGSARVSAPPPIGHSLPITKYGFVLCFATLHHLPGRDLRVAFLKQARAALAGEGRFFLSVWQFLNSPKLARRVQPWAAAGLAEADVEAGDYLLDWRTKRAPGLRYVHHFNEAELAGLAAETGFDVEETYHHDGAAGDLGLYMVWRRA